MPRRQLLELVSRIQQAGGSLDDLWTFLLAHRNEIATIVSMLLSMLGPKPTFGAGAADDLSDEEFEAELANCGCPDSVAIAEEL